MALLLQDDRNLRCGKNTLVIFLLVLTAFEFLMIFRYKTEFATLLMLPLHRNNLGKRMTDWVSRRPNIGSL